MTPPEAFGTVVAFSGLAALCAALGAVPQALGEPPSRTMLGWANALAGGLMLGVAYALLTEGLGGRLVAGGVGALVGIGLVRATHAVAGTGELDSGSDESRAPGSGFKLVLVDALHAADEGVAIGIAMALSIPLGIATASTLALHNVPEAIVLTSALTGRGLLASQSTAVAVAVNVNQVIGAALTYWLVALYPALLPWVSGVAVGALIYRTLVELLPESYEQAGPRSIAMITLLAIGVVVLVFGATS